LFAILSRMNSVLQPLGVPIWVIGHVVDQAGPQGVGDNVTRDGNQLFFFAQCMIVESRRPESAAPTNFPIQKNCASRLEALHDGTQFGLTQLKEQVHVIRHDDPAQIPGILQAIGVIEVLAHDLSKRKHLEPGDSLGGDRSEQVCSAFLRESPLA